MAIINIGSEKHFFHLIDLAKSMLNKPAQQLEDKYADYPICLMEYREKGKTGNYIEIYFDSDLITITCLFDVDNICILSYLFFDKYEHEDAFIKYLEKLFIYDYRRKIWILDGCYLETRESDGHMAWKFWLDSQSE